MVVKSVEIDLSVSGDAESKAKLDAISLKADELKKAFPTFTAKIDTAAATAKLQVFRADFAKVAATAAKPMEVNLVSAKAQKTLDDIRLRADKLKATFPEFTAKIDDTAYKAKLAVMAAEAKVTGDIISKELSGGGGVNLGGGAGGAAGAAESGAGSIGPIPLPALLAIVPALGAALVEVTGLVSGFAAATAGAGAFALLAAPAVKKVETAYTNLNTAQQAYQTAQAKYAADPTKATATAQKNALDNLNAQKKLLADLPASERGAAAGIQQLVTQFGKLSTAFQPEAFKVFNAALQLAGKLLPAITPFARTFADVVTTLLTQAGKFAQSKGFTDWLKQFQSLEGPALTAIGDGIGKVIIAVGKLLTTMNAADVARSIGIAFNVIAGAIDGLAYVVKRIMTNWDQMSSAAKRVTHDVAASFDTLRTGTTGAFRDMASAVLQFGIIIARAAKTITGVFLDMVGNIINGAAKAFGWIPGLGGKLRGAAADFSTWRTGVNSDFDKVIAKMQAWQNGLNAAKNTAASATASIGSNISGMGVLANTAGGKVLALNTALTRLPKSTSVSLTESGTGTFTISQLTGQGLGVQGPPPGVKKALGGLITQGTGPTADDVLVWASRGELWVPAHMVAAGEVDHLRGRLPGFASGGMVGGSIGALPGATTGFYDRFTATVTAAMEKAMTAAMKAAVAAATKAAAAVAGAMGTGGVSNASGVAALKSAAAKHGWTSAAEWAALNNVEMREAGYSLTATNPTSGAYGMAQFINGPSEYAQYGGNSTTYAGQATAMANYIAQRYGDPIAAWAHEQAYGWYGSGLDAMFSRPTLIGVGERGPEHVTVTPGGGQDQLGPKLDRLIAAVEHLTGVTASVPARTGQHVGAAIGGAAHDASFRARYH